MKIDNELLEVLIIIIGAWFIATSVGCATKSEERGSRTFIEYKSCTDQCMEDGYPKEYCERWDGISSTDAECDY